MIKFTNSRLNCLAECPQKHHRAYVQGYRLIKEDSDALNFGSAFHWLLEQYELAQKAGDFLSDPRIEQMTKGQGADMDPFEKARCQALFEGYRARWIVSPLTWLAVEAEWEAPLVHPITGEVHPRVRLGGKIDGIVQDGGKTLIVEHKTSGEDIGAGTTYWERKRLDTQISLYYLGARAIGYDVDGCLYDVSKKPGMRPKKKSAEVKLKKDGTPYANQQAADETPEDFYTRCIGEIASDLSSYYTRATLVRTQDELDRAMLDVWEQVEIWEASRGLHPRNTSACHRWGRPCQFFGDCTGDRPITEDSRFQIVENVHAELAA